jgi:hypothetical protein
MAMVVILRDGNSCRKIIQEECSYIDGISAHQSGLHKGSWSLVTILELKNPVRISFAMAGCRNYTIFEAVNQLWPDNTLAIALFWAQLQK